MSWLTKVYTGSKLHALWQCAIGFSIAITVVIVPTWMEYWDLKANLYRTVHVADKNTIHRQVYEERLRLRSLLNEREEKQ